MKKSNNVIKNSEKEKANALQMSILQSAIDFHYHCMMMEGYRWNLVKAAKECQKIGMKAIVLKNRYGLSSELAYYTNRLIGNRFFIGSLVLNRWNGGLNEKAVRDFCSYGEGIKIVEMPTYHAVNEKKWRGQSKDEGVKVFSGKHLTDPAKRVLEAISELKLTLKTGHLSANESILLIEKAKEFGIKKIVVTHATGPPILASINEQKEMVLLGAYIEHCIVPLMPKMHKRWEKRYVAKPKETFNIEPEKICKAIQVVGPEHCILGTDYGQDINPSSATGMIKFVKLLLKWGFDSEQIRRMIVDNPKKILF